VFSKSAFTSSMARWKTHFATGTKAFAHLSSQPSSLLQRDRPTLLHALTSSKTLLDAKNGFYSPDLQRPTNGRFGDGGHGEMLARAFMSSR
ncbi:MAG TPA: hypothetical protein VK638_44630, partial [Edaphobacter sp.]|nr:hypothetical protein [Edaphobacter sp.]